MTHMQKRIDPRMQTGLSEEDLLSVWGHPSTEGMETEISDSCAPLSSLLPLPVAPPSAPLPSLALLSGNMANTKPRHTVAL